MEADIAPIRVLKKGVFSGGVCGCRPKLQNFMVSLFVTLAKRWLVVMVWSMHTDADKCGSENSNRSKEWVMIQQKMRVFGWFVTSL